MFDDKRLLITGGTGSFGKTVVKKLLEDFNPGEIIIYSRDEKKQFDMRNKFEDQRLKFIIGDIREREKVFRIMRGIDLVFHAAALKQVPTCEFFPMEAVKTNVMGTNNVLDAAEDAAVEKVVVLSTDKAVYPINAMGITKALLEKITLAKARATKTNTVSCGAGEIVINSIDNDGLMKGYDMDLIDSIYHNIDVPLTVLGGAGSLEDIGKLISRYNIIGAAAGSLFVFKGKYRAVLINYPNAQEKENLYKKYLGHHQ